MISLTATTDSLIITTSTTAPLDFSTTFITLNTTAQTFVPGTNKGKIVTATDTTVVAAPTGTDNIQAKIISITNIDPAVTNVISVSKLSTATKYKMTPDITLLAGESFVYMHGAGWIYYAANGSVKAQQTANGSTNWIQYNVGGLLGSSANFKFDPSINDLSLTGTDANFIMQGVTNEPSAPASGNLIIYNAKFAGRQILRTSGSLGIAMFPQDAFWFKNILRWQAAIAAGTSDAGSFTNAGTAALVAVATTNRYTTIMRSSFASIVTTTNQQVGIRSTSSYWMRGGAANQGGFFFACRFGFQSYKSGCRLFVGMAVTGAAIVTVDPSSLTNILGFGFDLADSQITFYHNDGSGTATKEALPGSPPALANNQGYEAYIWCAPDDTSVYYRLVDMNLNVVIVESSVNTDLPVNTTALGAVCLMSNGTANIVAGDASIGINKLHIESEL